MFVAELLRKKTMSELEELKNRVCDLSVSDRLSLVSTIIESLNGELRPRRNKKGAAKRLIGIGKTDAPPPSDAEVKAMLEERLVEKYLL